MLLPDALPAGRYEVRVGMYTWPALVRERIYVDGQDKGDSVLLAQFQLP